WYSTDPGMISGVFIEESIHAESISQGFSFQQYWNISCQLDGIPNYKPEVYWKTKSEAETILKNGS
ncbi:MAG: hypothetical protein N2445_08105, partial [Acidobacteria bacterium]|nr:hypothetical protein [Acidobacteriota bacterium]